MARVIQREAPGSGPRTTVTQWSDPVTNTPSIIQTGFGPYGQYLPGDGEAYCGPTSTVMVLYWLASNGLTQLAPTPFGGPSDPAAIDLERVIAGLMQTSIDTGTNGTGMANGMADYLAARGIGPDQFTLTSTGNPDLQWLATQLAPNVAQDPSTIVLANFSVGWYSQSSTDPDSFTNSGGHVLAPLVVDLDAGTVTIDNAYPAAFEDVPNEPSSNPQTVQITAVPSGWTLPGLDLPSEDYTQVQTAVLGGDQPGKAILWGGDAWALSVSALPASPGYRLATWTLDGTKALNTNGGTLEVLAPLSGSGGIVKYGLGSLVVVGPNALTGKTTLGGGSLVGTQATGAPLGTGTLVLGAGGTLQLAPTDASPAAVTVVVASGPGAQVELASGNATLRLSPGSNPSLAVTLGGNVDASTPNLERTKRGTLVLAPDGGLASLGSTAKVLVAGTGANLPVVVDGIVAPYLVGQDSDGSPALLTYDAATGLVPAAPVTSATTSIAQATSTTVYEALDDQVIDPGGTATVAALVVRGTAAAVTGNGATLVVGNQKGGSVAGIVLDGGRLSLRALGLGAAEGVLYTSAAGGLVAATIEGSGGLTTFGPGTLVLEADSSATLTGPVSINQGTVVASNGAGSALGAGAVSVAAGAVLEVTGVVTGPITVAQSGTLYLDGGVAQGDVSVAMIGDTTSAPGGTLQGRGQIAGKATVPGVIAAGPVTGTLELRGDVDFGGAAFFWQPNALVDDSTSQPGVGWNQLQFDAAGVSVGVEDARLTVYLDFGLVSDPDEGDAFWTTSHSWTLWHFSSTDWSGYWAYGNFYYASGSFALGYTDTTVVLTWTPSAPQGETKRRLARVAALTTPGLASFGRRRA